MNSTVRTNIYLFLAILIFAAAPSVIMILQQISGKISIAENSMISYCNLFFLGNLLATFASYIFYRKEKPFHQFKTLALKQGLGIIFTACLSAALAPALVFFALEKTSVTKTIISGRIEPVLLALFSFFFFKESLNKLKIFGLALSLFGIFLGLKLSPSLHMMQNLGLGELYALAAAFCLACSSTLSKKLLNSINLGFFIIGRSFVGTLFYFIFTILIFGPKHFMDLFEFSLWPYTIIYGILIIFGGQLFWFSGIKKASLFQVASLSSLSPALGIIVAYLLLQEIPQGSTMLAILLIVLGTFASSINFAAGKTNIQHLNEIKSGFKGS